MGRLVLLNRIRDPRIVNVEYYTTVYTHTVLLLKIARKKEVVTERSILLGECELLYSMWKLDTGYTYIMYYVLVYREQQSTIIIYPSQRE